MQWPPSELSLAAALKAQEHSDFELKQQWYDFNSKRGKAEFVKDVLAIANSTQPDRPGYIVFGIEDPKHGGRVLGVEKTPDAEQLQQILSSYTNPVPDLQCVHLSYAGVIVSLVRIAWTAFHPYYAIRDCDGVLDSRFVYVRRGGTVGILRPRELEDLLRQKEGRVGRPQSEQILEVGFVESGQYGSKIVARIVNLTDEPVADVGTTWDIRLPGWPGVFSRVRSFTGSRLPAGETREDELDPTIQYFNPPDQNPNVRAGIQGGTRWFDITLRVQFRDQNGFLQQIEKHLSVSS